MNLTFTDVSTSFLNMFQQDISSGAVPISREPGSGRKKFAERLDRTLTSANRPGEGPDSISRQESNGPVDASKVPDIISNELENKQGHRFVSALQAVFLMLSNGRLENISMDPSGLEKLQKRNCKLVWNVRSFSDEANESC